MLEIVKFNEDEYDFPCLIVLGCFDGIHTGHTELLKKAKLQAKINGLDLGVMLFSEGKGEKQIYTFDERLNLLEKFNTKFVLKIDFTEDFKKIKPLEFLSILEEKLNVKAYMSGKDFKFGAGKKGKSSTLKSYAEDEENGVWYLAVKDVTDGDEKISTTRIKELIESGDIVNANRLLGRNYSVKGIAEHGADRGGKLLGYPTANIAYPANKVEVKQGVYKIKCYVNGNEYQGIANYGARPTFGEEEALLEVYLLGLEGEHYGEEFTVEFLEYIRETQKFDSAEELAEQLKKDVDYLNGVAELAVADGGEEQPAQETKPVEEPAAEVVTEHEEKPAAEIADDGFNDMVTEDFQPDDEKDKNEIPTVSGELGDIAPEESERKSEEPETPESDGENG